MVVSVIWNNLPHFRVGRCGKRAKGLRNDRHLGAVTVVLGGANREKFEFCRDAGLRGADWMLLVAVETTYFSLAAFCAASPSECARDGRKCNW